MFNGKFCIKKLQTPFRWFGKDCQYVVYRIRHGNVGQCVFMTSAYAEARVEARIIFNRLPGDHTSKRYYNAYLAANTLDLTPEQKLRYRSIITALL